MKLFNMKFENINGTFSVLEHLIVEISCDFFLVLLIN